MIARIPVSQFPSVPTSDHDVINAFEWFRSFISDKEWERKIRDIEMRIGYTFQDAEPFSRPLTEGTLMAVPMDQMMWYLYLVYTFIYEPYKYEYYQGARIVPIFKRIGMHLEQVKGIPGINKKVQRAIKKSPAEADAILFELLTALLWVRNGYGVQIIEEGKGGKTPDFLATRDGKTWQIECKRLRKTSDYTYRETAKRQNMITQIGKILVAHNILLDVIFHVEIVDLPDSYLRDLLEDKINGKTKVGILVEDEEVTIKVAFVNLQKINDHLKDYIVKNNSPQLLELVAQKPVEPSGFTCAIQGNFFRVGDGDVNNVYIDQVVSAFGVQWYCDAEAALWAKARDIKKQIKDAISQFGSEMNGVVHVGIETFDGPEVEKLRVKKILDSMEALDPNDSRLRWIFCHYFQSYSTPGKTWVFDETVDRLTGFVDQVPPIIDQFLVVDNSDLQEGDYHWNRTAPR